MVGAVDADGQAHRVLEDQDHEGDAQGQGQILGDDVPDGPPVFKGVAKVALGDNIRHPVKILDVPGLIQSELHPQLLDLLGGHDLTLCRHGGGVGGGVVSGGQLDDEEDHHGDDENGRYKQKEPFAYIFEHFRTSFRLIIGTCRRRSAPPHPRVEMPDRFQNEAGGAPYPRKRSGLPRQFDDARMFAGDSRGQDRAVPPRRVQIMCWNALQVLTPGYTSTGSGQCPCRGRCRTTPGCWGSCGCGR